MGCVVSGAQDADSVISCPLPLPSGSEISGAAARGMDLRYTSAYAHIRASAPDPDTLRD